MTVSIGFINYGVAGGYTNLPYLPTFLSSLRQQTYTNIEILCLDNNSTDGSKEYIRSNFPEIQIIESNYNTGFTGHNTLISHAKGDFYWCVNTDMYYEQDTLTLLVHALSTHRDYASVGPLLLRWDFKNKQPTSFVDSAGIDLYSSHFAREKYTGVAFEQLPKAYRTSELVEVFGISGASALYRIKALDEIQQEGACFEPHFFMYKEDIDLAYTLRWAGWKHGSVPKAIGYHDRTTTENSVGANLGFIQRLWTNRDTKSNLNKILSLRNHLLLLYRNISFKFSRHTLLRIFWFELSKFIFVILFERDSFKAYTEAFQLIRSGQIQKTKKRAAPSTIESLFMTR